MIDTNIRRILRRVFFWPADPSEREIEALAETIVPPRAPDLWHHALMDLGSLVCTSGRPSCPVCPLKAHCQAYPEILSAPIVKISKQNAFKNSDRFWRGRIVALLLQSRGLPQSILLNQLTTLGTISTTRLQEILHRLKKERIIALQGRKWMITK